MAADGGSAITAKVRGLGLSAAQLEGVRGVWDLALRDAM